MVYRFRSSLPVVLFAMSGCFNPDDGDMSRVDSDTDDVPGSDGSSSTGFDPTTGVSTTNETDGGQTSVDTTVDDTDAEPVCGDGLVEGDEVCDDGINDGSYGSCLEDCSGLADHCGDGIVNGPEACDDGVNDGSYDGCAEDCLSLGPFCGDGVVQEDHEMCDEGDDNENGSGCNVDCVTSGTKIYVLEESFGECDGETTNPVFRANGNVLLAARGCSAEAFFELTPELEVHETTQTLLPSMPFRATMRGTDWLLGAWTCDYQVAENGSITEVCDSDRITGYNALEALDDQVYIALRSQQLGHFGANSPSQGDAPNWVGEAPATVSWTYWLNSATFGGLGTVVAAGEARHGSSSPYTWYGHVRRWTAAGNLQTTRTFTQMTFFSEIRATPDGGFLLRGSGNGNNLMKIDQTLNFVWAKAGSDISSTVQCSSFLEILLVDSNGDIVVQCDGPSWPDRFLVKLDSDGDERWSLDLENTDYYSWARYGIDADDWIVRSRVRYEGGQGLLVVEKISP